MWDRRAHETDQAAGDIDWKICYDDLYVSATADGQVLAVDCPGRCNRYVHSRAVISVEISCICGRDLTNELVVNECLDGIRKTGTLWLPLANMYNSGLAKVDLAGKGKTRQGENGVGFVTGAYTDRF
jgi:hypothetical protein